MFLGVDGGGTKTALCLMTGQGELAASAVAPSCYYFRSGIDLVAEVLDQGVSDVCDQAGIEPKDIEQAFFGLPGYGEVSADTAALDQAPRAVLGHDRYSCDNDMVCAWAGSLAGADGINIVSGTGSIAYGERKGIRVRVGGWGEAFGDEGSGHWLAIRVLQVFSHMSDGRLPAGPLLTLLRERLNLAHDLDLVGIVLHDWKGDRREIAALAPIVVRAAREGDAEAQGILQAAGHELARIVDATRRRLAFPHNEQVPLSYSGGVFSAHDVLVEFRANLGRLHDRYELRHPLYPPVVGAALYAAKRAAVSLPQQLLLAGGGLET